VRPGLGLPVDTPPLAPTRLSGRPLRSMGFIDESYATLLSPLRRGSPKEKAAAGCNSKREQECTRDFDIMDSMEKGLARELVADFLEPLPDAAGLWKFNVERSDDRTEYRLFCNSGEFLMYAKLARGSQRIDIHLYDPSEKDNALFDRKRPAFSMMCNSARTEWSLYQDQCDNCRHSPSKFAVCRHCGGHSELLRVRHNDAEIGEGVNHCMEVSIPYCGYDACPGEMTRFVTKMPVWNERVECLVLDFKGRKVLASAKNFQLAAEGDEGERVVCQYGKVGTSTFGLDFRYPLTVAQAFGISLSTLFWV